MIARMTTIINLKTTRGTISNGTGIYPTKKEEVVEFENIHLNFDTYQEDGRIFHKVHVSMVYENGVFVKTIYVKENPNLQIVPSMDHENAPGVIHFIDMTENLRNRQAMLSGRN